MSLLNPSRKAKHIFNAYSTMWFVSGAMDSIVTGTVYIFASLGFDRDKGDCVSGQVETEATLLAVATVAGVIFAVVVMAIADLKEFWHIFFLSLFTPYYLLVDNNLLAHCSFNSEKTKEGVLVAYAPLNIFTGIVHMTAIVFLLVPRERDETDSMRQFEEQERGIPMQAVHITDGKPQDTQDGLVDNAKAFYNDYLRVSTLSFQFAVASDHVMTGVQEIMLYRGFDPESAKCVDGQAAVELSLIILLTALGILVVPCWGLGVISENKTVHPCWRLFNVLIALALVPGYVFIENAQVVHCYVKGGESGSKAIVLATFNFAFALMKMVYFLKYKVQDY